MGSIYSARWGSLDYWIEKFSGFLGKETWVDPVENEVVMLIRWQTRELWKSVPQSVIDELDAKMGELQMPIAESREYTSP